MDELKKKRFLLGLLLAWLPWLPAFVGLAIAFRGIFSGHATGIAVAVAGFSEMFVLIGLISTVVFAIGSIVLLSRAFLPGHPLRTIVAAGSMGLSVLMLLFVGLFCWLLTHHS
jgi:hypothetical protein